MCRKLKYFIVNFVLLLPLFIPVFVKADDGFNTSIFASYDVGEGRPTKVRYDIEIVNASSDLYATSYALKLRKTEPENIKATEGNRRLKVSKKIEDDGVLLRISFDESTAGEGKTKSFSVEFDDNQIATKTGDVWEVVVPGLRGESFNSYVANLTVPKSFGELAFMSPSANNTEEKEGKVTYTFNKENLIESGVTASFGTFQLFNFDIIYHLENTTRKNIQKTIAIPPDTNYQRLYYQKMDPEPEYVDVDDDGNWIATYNLKRNERVDLNISGVAQLFAQPKRMPNPRLDVLMENMRSTKYWTADDPAIKELAQKLKTPHAIYNWVVNNLRYDIKRIEPDSERLGAVGALNNTDSAICTEFTDLFIATVRSSGIPAREINGYAYTENPEIQPLSLVTDVLHSWPEYWDNENSVWVSVDPTWGATSRVDYFKKLDLRHFAFVIHGLDDEKPLAPGSYKLGQNPQKDVFVTVSSTKPLIEEILVVSVENDTRYAIKNSEIKVKISNDGNVASYNKDILFYFDDQLIKTENVPVVPPKGQYTTQVNVNHGLFGSLTPKTLRVRVDGKDYMVDNGNKNIVVHQSILIFFLIMLVVVSTYFRKYLRSLLNVIKLPKI
jgi:transglutaminase-like putative cysteine protease